MANATEHQQSSLARFMLQPNSDHVRMGPISLVALVVIISLAVLAMLSFSTANASLVLSQRQADAVEASYANERAAQEFVAGLDAVLARLRGDAAQAGDAHIDALCKSAQQAGGPGMTATASFNGNTLNATFATGNGKALDIRVTVIDGGTYRIDSWKMSAVHNQEQPEGRLFVADNT